jgi:GDP-L-fucose synthase
MKNVFLTGGSGFLGRFLIDSLKNKKYRITSPSSKECNLIKDTSLKRYKKKFDYIFHLAAWTQAGDFCLKYPGEQWIMNQKINTNVLAWWKENQPQAKLIFIGTSCAYSPEGDFKENSYLKGEPIESLYTYAMTKRMLLQGAKSIQKQFGLKWLCLVPSTLYGPSYHEDNRQMHFIFDLIRKIILGKTKKEKVILWGDGFQTREIIHVKDFIKSLFLLLKINNEVINIGSKKDYSIRHFARIISEIIDYDNSKIKFDKTKYVGSKNKKLNISKVKKIINDYEKNLTDEKKGIAEVINWFLKKR